MSPGRAKRLIRYDMAILLLRLSAKLGAGDITNVPRMTVPPASVPKRRSGPLARVRFYGSRPVITDVEQLLAMRTRDIRLDGEIGKLFRDRIWSQSAKIIRAWMIWVALLNVLMLTLSWLTLPPAVTLSMLVPGAVLSPVAIAIFLIWRKPRAQRLQRVALVVGMGVILLCVALIGEAAGGGYHERYLNIMMVVAISAIIIFGIPLRWTAAIAAITVCLYCIFQLRNPDLGTGSALAWTLFFACGIGATVVARHSMTLLAQKAFLLDLRDKTRVAELAAANDRLEELARTDPLTGVANRRWMTEILDALWSAPRSRVSGALLMCDIDDFKNLNDRLGHGEGDRCLIEVARLIGDCVRRDGDKVARYGGEEFLVLLRGVDTQAALATAERIRRSIADAGLANPGSQVSPQVTISIGVAALEPGDGDVTPQQLQKRADEALYLAKQSGRNRVVLYGADAACPERSRLNEDA